MEGDNGDVPYKQVVKRDPVGKRMKSSLNDKLNAYGRGDSNAGADGYRRKKQVNQSGVFNVQENEEAHMFNANNGPSRKPFLRCHEIDIDWNKQKHQVQLTIEDTEVYFPFEPYPQQREYMSKVIQALEGKSNALLQSPTGTGKTLCLLCATLGWLRKKRFAQKQAGEKQPCRIIYASRTHSQLQQVVKELKSTVYKPKMTVLASRDQYCLKKEFEMFSGSIRISACQKAIRGDDPMVSCKFFRGHHDDDQEEFSNTIMDIEDLKASGNCNNYCPYFYSRRYKDAVDILFLPYTYLLDSSGLTPFNIELTNAVILFDEAHNVQRVSEDGSSLSLSTSHLDAVEKEITILRDLLQNFRNPNDFKMLNEKTKNRVKKLNEIDTQGLRSSESICYYILSVTKSLKLWMAKEMEKKSNTGSDVYEGKKIFQILKEHAKYNPKIDETNSSQMNLTQLGFGLREIDLQKQQMHEQSPFFNGLDISNIDKYLDYVSKAIEDMSTTQNFGLDQVQVFLKLIKTLMASSALEVFEDTQKKQWVEYPINNYKLLIDFNRDKSELSLFMQCLDPSQSFSRLREKNPYNMIFTSGTLSPFDSWTAELKMNFPISLSNSHVIDTHNSLLAGIISKGPMGQDLSFNYDNRNNSDFIDDLGITILNLIKFIPNGVLIIFNSSSSFDICKQRWTYGEKRLMKQLSEIKNIVFEPSNSFELYSVMNKYTAQAKSTKGAILFAVCRGKISEGIDFTDELARAVFMIGVPYPPSKEPRVVNKKQHLDSIWNDRSITGDKLSGRKWYLQQAIRAMNQAIGRVIRHKDDWGAVFLCDSRFKNIDVKSEISDWVKQGEGLKEFANFPEAIIATKQFFSLKSQAKSSGNIQKQRLISKQSNLEINQGQSHLSELQANHLSSSDEVNDRMPTHSIYGKMQSRKPTSENDNSQHTKKASQESMSTSQLVESLSQKRIQASNVNNAFQPVGLKQKKLTDFKPTPNPLVQPVSQISSLCGSKIFGNNQESEFLEEMTAHAGGTDAAYPAGNERVLIEEVLWKEDVDQFQIQKLNQTRNPFQSKPTNKYEEQYGEEVEGNVAPLVNLQNRSVPLKKPSNTNAKLQNMVSPLIQRFFGNKNPKENAVVSKKHLEYIQSEYSTDKPILPSEPNSIINNKIISMVDQETLQSKQPADSTDLIRKLIESEEDSDDAIGGNPFSNPFQKSKNKDTIQQNVLTSLQSEREPSENRSQVMHSLTNPKSNHLKTKISSGQEREKASQSLGVVQNRFQTRNSFEMQPYSPRNEDTKDESEFLYKSDFCNQIQNQFNHNFSMSPNYSNQAMMKKPFMSPAIGGTITPKPKSISSLQKSKGYQQNRSGDSDELNSKQSVKSNEKCFICKLIPNNRCINNSCEHIGCQECFRKIHKKQNKCACGEEFSLKDLKPI